MVRTQGLLTSSTKIQKRPSRAQEGNSLTLTKKTCKAHTQAKLSSPSEHISFFTIIKTQVTWHGLTLYALNKSFPVMKNYWEVENLLCIQAHLIMMVDNCPLSSLRLLLATFTSHDDFWAEELSCVTIRVTGSCCFWSFCCYFRVQTEYNSTYSVVS